MPTNAPGVKPVSEDDFRDEVRTLRRIAPVDGHGLLDELEHRWTHPLAPPALYLLTCEACAHEGFTFWAGEQMLERRAPITKFGQARRSLAGRLARYVEQNGMKHVGFTDGSLVLRAAIFGRGSVMLKEKEIRNVAKRTGTRLHHVHESGRRSRIGNESFVGDTIIDPISALASERAALLRR